MTDETAKVDPRDVEIWLTRFETFHPKDGHGSIAKFSVVIADIVEIRNFKLRKLTDGRIVLSTARLERDGGFSVEIRKWLGKKILQMAIDRLREIARSDLAALDGLDVKTEDVPYVPGLDVAALPAQLMRAVR